MTEVELKKRTDPINNILWQKAENLTANAWNPNVVFTPELRLLERSILKTGWIQPILVTPKGTVIDGFHRWKLSLDSPHLQAVYHGLVPTVILDISEPEAMLMTVRINRAKGVHQATRMSDLVKSLLDDHGYDEQEVAQGIGATLEEVRLLHQDSIFKARNLEAAPYSRAWVPRESTHALEPAK